MSPYNDFDVEKTLLMKKYRHDLEHIKANKWFLSERAGKDVGWERALLNWII
jgi:hypothetical protein